MKKTILLEFIKKYSLNGVIDKCRWVSNSTTKTLNVSAASDSKTLLSDVTLSNWDGLGDVELGVGSTEKPLKALNGIYGDDITFALNYNDDKSRIVNVEVLYNEDVRCFTISDLDILPPSSKMLKVPVINAEIVIDTDFKERFLKAKANLPDVESFTIMMDKKGILKMVIGFSNINNDRHILSVKTTPGKDVVADPLHFNAKHLKEILLANPDGGDTVLCVSDQGAATISFVTGEFSCQYVLGSLDDAS